MPAKQARSRRGIGKRRELAIALPAALLMLVVLSTFALFAYRDTVSLLIEERRVEAAHLARKVSAELALGPLPDAAQLRNRLPSAALVAVLDGEGRAVVTTDVQEGGEAAPAANAERIVAIVPFKRNGQPFAVHVELAAPTLLSRERGLRILAPVVLTLNGAITLLVLLFLRRFLAPFEGLLERARDAGQAVSDADDEVVFLVETFEQALAALAERPAADEVDELKTLEGALTRSLESGVLLCDAAGGVLALNDVGAALLDVPPPPPGRPVAEVLARHDALRTILERAIDQGQGVKREECTVTGPAGERHLGVTAHPLRRADAEVRGYLVLFADLTEAHAEAQKKQLGDSLSQLGELTAGVAHELRNSLATLRGYLTLAEREPEREPIGDYLAEIRRESDHLQRVLEDFLSFARPGSARPQDVDLAGLAHRAAADPALGEAAVCVEAAASGLSVQGDPQLLERALRNLLTNAVEAQRQVGCADPVRVWLRAHGQGVEIAIDDRGPGLSPEAQEKLFNPFFTQRPGGVGMGLALTRRIALLHSGRVELANRPAGGTRATLWIPSGSVALRNSDAESERQD